MKPVQVPLFDESGENVEDKRKREKEEAARIAAAAKKAEEEEKLRKATCESLIRNAKELKEAGKYKMPCRNWPKHAIWEWQKL